MTKPFLLFATSLIFIACNKNNESAEQENLCPMVAKNDVPSVVRDAFSAKYVGENVLQWYNKDNVGYCAAFLKSGAIETIAQFDNNGNFISEETDLNQQGEFQDSTGVKAQGCECEFPEHE